MAQVPFTEEGVAQKVQELYALNQTNLRVEADRIRTEFKNWIIDNFGLTDMQRSYLDLIDDTALRVLSTETSASVENRHNIVCRIVGPEGPIGAKRFEIMKEVTAFFQSGITNESSGTMEINFRYTA